MILVLVKVSILSNNSRFISTPEDISIHRLLITELTLGLVFVSVSTTLIFCILFPKLVRLKTSSFSKIVRINNTGNKIIPTSLISLLNNRLYKIKITIENKIETKKSILMLFFISVN